MFSSNLFETFEKHPTDLLVSLRELGGDFIQKRTNLFFRERHDPGDDPAGAS
jgi:hypothetical protein